jgi:type IV pilus assembly protein PilP
MTIARALIKALPLAVVSLLSGCGDGGLQEVRDWMKEVRAQTPVSAQKISEPKKFVPFAYTGKEEMDPYNAAKLSVALAKMQANSNSGIKPDMDRRKEPLESYPLDSIKMVGTLEKPGLSYALLQVDKVVFQAKVGNYVGQNFGMITKITDTEVEIKEIIRDPAGEWTERKAKLELQENKK